MAAFHHTWRPVSRKAWSLRSMIMITVLLLMIFLLSSPAVQAREIVDMTGRRVTVPETVAKVYVPSPYGSYIVYSIDPRLLVSFNLPVSADERYLHPAVRNLPVIGRLSGPNRQADLQAVQKAQPDLVIMWAFDKSAAGQEQTKEMLHLLDVPVVYVVAESLDDYPDIYAFLGKLLGREERAGKLSVYCRNVLEHVAEIVAGVPAVKRPKVYYAEGPDGLRTECDDSIHVEMLRNVGDVNVHRGHTSCHKGKEPVSLEQVIRYAPDVIIAQDKAFYDKVVKQKAPVWQQVKAVNEGRVLLIPKNPFNWFDRPPSFMRILGLQWLMSQLYPEANHADFISEARGFYRLFLGLDVSREEMQRILDQ